MQYEIVVLRPSPLDKEWLDGPKLANWIREHCFDLTAQLGDDMRRLQLWEKGDAAHIETADRVLVRLECHIHELPLDFWIASPSASRPRNRTGQFAAGRRQSAT
jgi:hypothetical protein